MDTMEICYVTPEIISEKRDWCTTLWSVVFGIGSWIAMTGLWVEMPLLVQNLPEGWTLASQLALYLQIANIGPIIYGLIWRKWPYLKTERWATHLQLAIGAGSTLLLVFLWKTTVWNISLPLFVLSFGLSIVDCTSSVVFLPFMAHYKSCYLTPYLVGEGLSGLLPSFIALAQGVRNPECVNGTFVLFQEPRFEPEYFFAFLLLLVLISWFAFVMLEVLPVCKKQKVPTKENGAVDNNSPLQEPPKYLELWFLALQGWASIATFGVFPALQPYSCLPYGEQAYHLAATLCGIVYPAACWLAMGWKVTSIQWLTLMSVMATIISAYAIVTAAMSPVPPLVESSIGPPIVVIVWVVFMGLFSYIKTMATVLLGEHWGHPALFWCGVVTQGGAAIGALVMFLLVNVFDIFQDESACEMGTLPE